MEQADMNLFDAENYINDMKLFFFEKRQQEFLCGQCLAILTYVSQFTKFLSSGYHSTMINQK